MIAATAALVGYAGFLVVVFVCRTNGSRWVRFASRADAVGETVLVVSVTCSLVSCLLVLCGGLHPWTGWTAVVLIGALVLVCGVAIALTAQRPLGAAWRPGIDPSDRPALVAAWRPGIDLSDRPALAIDRGVPP